MLKRGDVHSHLVCILAQEVMSCVMGLRITHSKKDGWMNDERMNLEE